MDVATPPSWLSLEDARECLRRGTGRGVRIAVLDSGIETDHPALRDTRLADDVAVKIEGNHLAISPGQGEDVFGHGTAIASIIRRLAPEAEIGSFRVLGELLDSRTAVICEGAFQALDCSYHILNCSFGCSFKQHALQYKSWIDTAYLRGVHVIAAGNSLDASKPEWPSHFSSVISVSAHAAAEESALYYRRGHLVEFAARGVEVEVAWKGGAQKKVSGSSYASPHVAALLARLLSCCPDLTPAQAKALLQRLATPWPNGALQATPIATCA
jgi:subtilisin